MFLSPQEELRIASDFACETDATMQSIFFGPDIPVVVKPDGTACTQADYDINEAVVSFYGQRGIRVAGEEGGSASFGEQDIMVLDPLDGTNNLIDRNKMRARTSTAMFSLAWVKDRPVMGVVRSALLYYPFTIMALEGEGTFCEVRNIDRLVNPVRVSTASRGIVLTSDAGPQQKAINQRLERMGFTPLVLQGSVFKAVALVCPNILNLYEPGLTSTNDHIVGFVSLTAQLHDFAATSVIVREGEGIATHGDGTMITSQPKMGCIMANTPRVHECLLDAVNG